MKRKSLIKILSILLLAVISSYHVLRVSSSEKEVLSDLMLRNIEALSQSEETELKITCYSGTRGSTAFLCKCGSCVWGYTYTTDKSTCY